MGRRLQGAAGAPPEVARLAPVPVQVPSVTPLTGLGSKSGSLGAADAPLLPTVRLTLATLPTVSPKSLPAHFPRAHTALNHGEPPWVHGAERDPPPWATFHGSLVSRLHMRTAGYHPAVSSPPRGWDSALPFCPSFQQTEDKFLFLSPNPSLTLPIPPLGRSPSGHFSPSPPAALGQR